MSGWLQARLSPSKKAPKTTEPHRATRWHFLAREETQGTDGRPPGWQENGPAQARATSYRLLPTADRLLRDFRTVLRLDSP